MKIFTFGPGLFKVNALKINHARLHIMKSFTSTSQITFFSNPYIRNEKLMSDQCSLNSK